MTIEEKLNGLIFDLLTSGIVSRAWLAQSLGMSLIDFLEEYKDIIYESDKECGDDNES